MLGSVFRSRVLDVYVNIYNLQENQSMLNSIGLGTHHSGVQVGEYEYYFSTAGICRATARREEFGVFHERILFGSIESQGKVNEVLNALRASGEWVGTEYNLCHRNCNHFSEAFTKSLFPRTEVNLPPWLNRVASWGSWLYPSSSQNNVGTNGAGDQIVMPGQASGSSAKAAAAVNGDGKEKAGSKDGMGKSATGKKQLTEKQKQALANLKKKPGS